MGIKESIQQKDGPTLGWAHFFVFRYNEHTRVSPTIKHQPMYVCGTDLSGTLNFEQNINRYLLLHHTG